MFKAGFAQEIITPPAGVGLAGYMNKRPNEGMYDDLYVKTVIIDNGKIVKISSVANMLSALKGLGMDLEPVVCGGKADEWDQEREQWHSGANFFAFAPGKVISYARNTHTLDELASHGFEIIPAWDVIEGRASIEGDKKCVVTVEGSELPRGGGGARCMTMPLSRKAVQW